MQQEFNNHCPKQSGQTGTISTTKSTDSQTTVRRRNVPNLEDCDVQSSSTSVVPGSRQSHSSHTDNKPQLAASNDELDLKSWGAPNHWSDAQWQHLEGLIKSGVIGEELMKAFGFKRRKDLEVIFYKLSLRKKKYYEITWLTDYEGGAHALPELKSNKDGGLRISSTRFARHGFNVQPNTFFDFKKISDTEIKLTIIR